MNSGQNDKTSLSISISTSATMVGFSIAIITLILSSQNINKNFGLQVVIGLYILSILLNFSSIEFLNLSSWDDENFLWWNAIGASLYGSAKVFMIISLSLTCLVLMKFFLLAIGTLSVFLCFEMFYYYERLIHKKTKQKTDNKPNTIRWVARIAMLLEVAFGFVLIFWIKLYIT